MRRAFDAYSIFYVRNLNKNLSAVIPNHNWLLAMKEDTFQMSSKILVCPKKVVCFVLYSNLEINYYLVQMLVKHSKKIRTIFVCS